MTHSSARLATAAACAVLAALLLIAGGTPRAAAQPEGWRAKPDRTPAAYTLDVTALRTIDGEAYPRVLDGVAKIDWTNGSRERVAFLYLHLYANAFRDERSAFMTERARSGGKPVEDPLWGGCEVRKLLLADSAGRQPKSEFVPAPGAPDDRTVLKVTLPEPVEPGGRVVLHVEFTTTLPKPVARMGAVRDFVMAAQWYPKLGRHLGAEAGAAAPHLADGWFCHHYHAATEFAADFADYDVRLTLPDGWIAGATGVPAGAETRDAASGTTTWRFEARSVVDFAWTAGVADRSLVQRKRTIDPDEPSPDLGDSDDAVMNTVRGVRALLGLTPEDADLPPVEVVLLLQPEHEDQARRYFESARVALALFGTWLGPYPYPRLTIVDPPAGVPVGGMEYPTLVTAGTTIDAYVPARRLEHVTVHEIGHQWFMNLLASNEALEGWLDEGLNSWFTAHAMDIAWGPNAQLTEILGLRFDTELPYSFPGVAAGWPAAIGLPKWMQPPQMDAFRLWRDGPMLVQTSGLRYPRRLPGDPESPDPVLPARRSYLRSAGWDPLVRPGWEYASTDSYRGNAYPRGVLVLESLARHVRAKFDSAGGGIAAREGERRVIQAFREYARQWRFRHPATADLVRTLQRETGLPQLVPLFELLTKTPGLVDYAVTEPRIVEDEPESPGGARRVRSEVTLRRTGQVAVPVSVRIRVEDADEPRVVEWAGGEAWTRFEVPGRVRSVEIDPLRLLPMDARLSDNSWRARSSARPAAKWGVHSLLWLENALAGWGRFF